MSSPSISRICCQIVILRSVQMFKFTRRMPTFPKSAKNICWSSSFSLASFVQFFDPHGTCRLATKRTCVRSDDTEKRYCCGLCSAVMLCYGLSRDGKPGLLAAVALWWEPNRIQVRAMFAPVVPPGYHSRRRLRQDQSAGCQQPNWGRGSKL